MKRIFLGVALAALACLSFLSVASVPTDMGDVGWRLELADPPIHLTDIGLVDFVALPAHEALVPTDLDRPIASKDPATLDRMVRESRIRTAVDDYRRMRFEYG